MGRDFRAAGAAVVVQREFTSQRKSRIARAVPGASPLWLSLFRRGSDTDDSAAIRYPGAASANAQPAAHIYLSHRYRRRISGRLCFEEARLAVGTVISAALCWDVVCPTAAVSGHGTHRMAGDRA